jgi:hypothetical protein
MNVENPRNFFEADDILNRLVGTRGAPGGQGKKIANNTTLRRKNDGSIAVRLHETDIITFTKGGKTTLDTGGWASVTTKERMNRYMPGNARIAQKKGQWLITSAQTDETPYVDGMTIARGKITTPRPGKKVTPGMVRRQRTEMRRKFGM